MKWTKWLKMHLNATLKRLFFSTIHVWTWRLKPMKKALNSYFVFILQPGEEKCAAVWLFHLLSTSCEATQEILIKELQVFIHGQSMSYTVHSLPLDESSANLSCCLWAQRPVHTLTVSNANLEAQWKASVSMEHKVLWTERGTAESTHSWELDAGGHTIREKFHGLLVYFLVPNMFRFSCKY